MGEMTLKLKDIICIACGEKTDLEDVQTETRTDANVGTVVTIVECNSCGTLTRGTIKATTEVATEEVFELLEHVG